MNRNGRRGEQRQDYRHSKKSDRVFRKLNALALPGSAATGNPCATALREHAIFRHHWVRVWQERVDISRFVRSPLSAFEAN